MFWGDGMTDAGTEPAVPMPGCPVVGCGGMAIFNEPHMASVILYIRDNPGCGRTDIYRGVARGNRMSVKIGMLIDAGLAEDASPGARCSTLSLTPAGELVADHLAEIKAVLG